MSEWKKVNIGNLGRIVTGKTPKTEIDSYYGGDMPFLTPSDDWTFKYVNNTKKYITEEGKNSVKGSLLPPNAVCVSCIGIIGKVLITTQETVTNQQINSIIVDEERYDVDFIYYAMVQYSKILESCNQSSTVVPIINKSTFSEFEILCPALSEQKKISKILSIIDQKINLNNQINDNLVY
ncbi:membrane protein [Ureaplasma diversum]|uniref:Membrane protein n=1 Tax=Ureaplasma diversum TaxID=42094 RepID=A0A0C5S1A6_9BACT|nr:restriction endonuclease subunit S [Ureaplasma diversum]AJQ45170.1 membrane protein [Ureaplasma diversum]